MRTIYKGYRISVYRLEDKHIYYGIKGIDQVIKEGILSQDANVRQVMINCKDMIDEIILSRKDPTNEWAIPTKGM